MRTIVGFLGVDVFDVVQTDGESLPDVACAGVDAGEHTAPQKAAGSWGYEAFWKQTQH